MMLRRSSSMRRRSLRRCGRQWLANAAEQRDWCGCKHQNGSMTGPTFEAIQFVLRLILAAAFVFMGVTHFLPAVQHTMAAMIPPRMRGAGMLSPRSLVIVTGVCEIAGGLGLLFPPTMLAAGICLVAFLVAVFPAN